MPVTCGRPRIGSNAAPPLKSTRRNDTRSGGWPSASAAIQASRNSLLPLPVVPATIACGPSVARSSTSGPPATAPTAARSVSLEPGRRAGCAQRIERHGVGQGRGRRDALAVAGHRQPPRQRSRLGEARQRRARSRAPRDRRRAAARSRAPATSTTTTVSSPIGSPSTVSATAITTASCGEAPRASSMPRVASSSRTTVGPRRCGSPVAQAHSGPAAPRCATTPGRHRCATCTSSARAADLASADAPTTPIPPSAGASTGAPSRRAACASSSRSSASTGVPSTRTTLRAVPRPSTSCPGSPSRQSSGRRSSRIGAPARPAATPPCARARAARRWTHAAHRAARARSAAPFRCIRRPCRRASSTEATATTGPRAANTRESGEPVIAQSTTAPADRGDRGDPREAGRRRFGRVRRQRERHARRVGDVGEVATSVSSRSTPASDHRRPTPTRRIDRGAASPTARPPVQDECCATPPAPAAGVARAASSDPTRQATTNDCSASSTRLPRGTR